MKNKFFLALAFAANCAFAQNTYQYKLDLVNVEKDQVKVTLVPPKTDKDELLFIMPRAVQGSYAVKNYGRFVTKFTAYDNAGNKLKTKQKEFDKFYIYKAQSLARIEYLVDDTWDTKNKKNFVFQPGGSNIEAGQNFAVNTFCFFGYFDGFKINPFQIEVTKPEQMYGSGFLTKTAKDKNTDIINAPDYVFLADNPLMYCVPDTTSMQVAGCTIKISVYSATGVVKSSKVKEYLAPLGAALSDFLKGLPVNEYHFIFYFEDPAKTAKVKSAGLAGYGALEHNHSSFYYLPETKNEADLKETVVHVCGHEFLHLVTPLNLHSEEIANFDFLNPKMSQHLWMYEGVTEYYSQLVPLQGGIVTEKEFRKTMRSKINQGEDFGAFSMTEMSRNVITPQNQKLYESVYNKGAVLAMLLDIQIADLTKGEKNLKSVMFELAKKYGPTKPFNDDQLFDDIVNLTHPDIRKFINAHIVGTETPDYRHILDKIGWQFADQKVKEVYLSGYFGVDFDEKTSSLFFTNVGNNIFGLQNGDVLVSINWTDVTADNINEMFEKYFKFNESDKSITVIVKRNGTTKTLSGSPQKGTMTMHNYIGASEDKLSASQTMLRKFILHQE